MTKLLTNIKFVMVCVLISSTMAFAQNKEAQRQITNTYNLNQLNELHRLYKEKATNNKQRAITQAKISGWPLSRKTKEGAYQELIRLTTDGTPLYYTTFNLNASKSTRANYLNSGGGLGLNLNGQNMTAHIWDGGLARSTHQEYDGAGGSNRYTIGDGTSAMHYHSAHVAGTIIASGVDANAKGMAPYAKAIGYEWNSDLAEATTAATNGMLISNHSYGFRSDLVPDWYFGAYIDESRDWDNLLFNSPFYLMVVAAGNDGSTNYNAAPINGATGYDKLTGHATSKNNMVVANANDANINASGDLVSVSINTSSSQGPTDDLRIKPDITGNGTSVYSTLETSDNAYGNLTGTSMASPNVAGTLLLLQQHYNNVNGTFMRAATLKGLALHTADDAGTAGPDVNYGWGLLNAKRAATVITQNGNESRILQLNLASGQSYTTTVTSDGINKLIASISWTDPAGTANTGTTNLTTPVLVNNLDIRITQASTTYSPYKLTSVTSNAPGDNNVDNYERVDVTGASGTYTVTVTHKGTLQGGSQNYSLIITGITGTPPVCNATVPTGLSTSAITASGATLSWTAVAGASYNVQYRAVGAPTWTSIATASNSLTLTGLSPNTAYEAQVNSKCPDNTTSAFSSSVNFTTTNVIITYCASKGNSVADEYIGRVQVGSINNATGANGGYGDFTALSTNLSTNTTYTLTVTPTWTSTVYSEGYAAWIDYNKDGDFLDAGEQIMSKATSTSTPASQSFTVPASAATGTTRLRVSMKYNGTPSSCETFSYGEVEDYTVNIQTGTPDTVAPTTPTNLATSSITATSANLSWTASTDNVGVTGYEVRLNGALTATVTTLNYSFSGLTANTTYTASVTAKDAAGNASTAASTSFTTLTSLTYCASKGNIVTDEYINRVQLGTINNLSGANAGYANYTALSTNVSRGSAYTITITPAWTGTVYAEGYAVWADYNKDGDFADAGEQVWTKAASTATPASGSFTIPATAPTGATRLRVSMKYNGIPTSCETFTYGEVEDYTINIQASPSPALAVNGEEFGDYSTQVYPNPVHDKLYLRMPADVTVHSIHVVSSNGIMLRAVRHHDQGIDVSDLQEGLYILSIDTDKGNMKKKFIKK